MLTIQENWSAQNLIKVLVYMYSAHYHKNKFLFSLIIKNTSLLTMINFKVNPSRLSEIKPVCPYLNNIISVKGMHPATHYNIDSKSYKSTSCINTNNAASLMLIYTLTL